MRDKFVELLDMPKQVVHIQHIPKKMIYEKGNLKKTQSKLIRNDIESIYVLFVLNEHTTNLSKMKTADFSYEEILWFYVKLRTTKNVEKVAEILQKLFPNPLIAVLESVDGKWCINTAIKRNSLTNTSQIIVGKIHLTSWIHPDDLEGYSDFWNALNINNYPLTNLYDVYNYINNQIRFEKSINLTGNFICTDASLEIIEEIEYLSKEVQLYKKEMKNVDNFSDQMDRHIKIREIESNISILSSKLFSEIN